MAPMHVQEVLGTLCVMKSVPLYIEERGDFTAIMCGPRYLEISEFLHSVKPL